MRNKKLFKWLILIIGCSLVLSFIWKIPITANNHKGRSYFEEQGRAIWEVRTKEKVIALTFDDGPSPTYTPQILDVFVFCKEKVQSIAVYKFVYIA